MIAVTSTYLDKSDDKALFEDMFYTYRKQMVLLSVSIVSNYEDAEDVVHNVFLRIAQNNWDTVCSIKEKNDLRNYLLKATKNASINLIKKNSKSNVPLDTVIEYSVNDDLSDNTFLDTVCNKIGYEEIIEAIKLLEEKYKNVLYYHFVMELSVTQTAKLLGQTATATKKQLVRGKKQLLNILEIKGGGDYVNG